jgi:hypothetical protein
MLTHLFLLAVLERQAGRLDEARRLVDEARRLVNEAVRWAADLVPMEAELRHVEQLLLRRNRKPATAWRETRPCYPDCSALTTTARA